MTKYRKSWTQVLEEVRESKEEIDELVAPGQKSHTGYILYHKDFSAAMQHAVAHAKKKGHTIDPKEIDDKVATGPKKPSKGKVNRYALKAGRKTVQIQVTNLDNKAYELNMYIEEVELEESAGLQLKMAFDDAKIKIKGVKGGKLVIAKKDKKEVEKIIAKQMKKPADAKRVLGSQIVFEDVELAEKGTAYPATIDTLKKIVKDKQHQTVMFDKGQAIVDLFSASAMVQVYDALKPATKKKFEDMIKSKEGFMKSQAFAMKMLK